ncbi:MAG TPA: hypothetical protein VHD36_22005, partial [Pirellulales bacterium]|nr:hypothetical protein [Pirellulales bacterium]
MNGVLALVAAATLGIDVGWQPLDDGGLEYIIQLEPQTLDSLRDGQDLSSQLPPSLQGVRTYRITVGNGPLPHEGEPPPATPNPAAVAKVPATGPVPQTTYQVPPPPAAEVPSNPNFAPSGATAPNGMTGPTPGPNGTGGRRYGAGITNAGPVGNNAPNSNVPNSGAQPGQLNLPPPPADPSVPPLHTEADPAPTTPPSNPPYEPPAATTRPSLGTDPGGTAPTSPGFMQSPMPSAPVGAGNSSSAPGFSYPGASPAMRGEPKAAPPPASAPAESAVERFKQREAESAKKTAAAEEEKETPTKDRASAKEPTPWLPLIGTLLALFAS